MSEYVVLAETHKSVAEAARWMSQALAGVDRDDVVSVTQSTAYTSGPGYYDWTMTTMLVVQTGVMTAPATTQAPAIVDAKSRCELILTGGGRRKILVTDLVRGWTGWGLPVSQEFVNTAPKTLFSALPREDAERLGAALTDAGATVEIRTQ